MKVSTFKNVLLISFFASIVAITGCEEKGPLEKAGESVDEAFENTGDALDDAADDVRDTADDAADEVEDATN